MLINLAHLDCFQNLLQVQCPLTYVVVPGQQVSVPSLQYKHTIFPWCFNVEHQAVIEASCAVHTPVVGVGIVLWPVVNVASDVYVRRAFDVFAGNVLRVIDSNSDLVGANRLIFNAPLFVVEFVLG